MTTAAVERALTDLPSVDLDALVDSSRLMTRVDRKYLLAAADADVLVRLTPAGTRVLDIDGRRCFGYVSTYLDTPGLLTYHLAARGRRRRFKVRVRSYVATREGYLEVKTRQGGRTAKTRLVGTHLDGGRLDPDGSAFVTSSLGAAGIDVAPVGELAPVVEIRYQRATLVVDDGAGRVTLDHGLRWDRPDGTHLEQADLVIVETKSVRRPTSLDRLLWSLGHRPRRVSKYATGLAALDPSLPANRWSRTLRDHF